MTDPTTPATNPLADATTTLTAKKPTPMSSIPGVSLTPTDASNDLRGQTLGVAPTADRTALATDYLNTWNQATQPQFQADLRGATSNAAATGKLGSGGLRTSLGDLTYNRDVQRNSQAKNFYTDALNGSIDDAYKNVGVAQQQQAFQSGLQNQTFNQDLAERSFENSAYNDQFSQNLATDQFNANRTDTSFNQNVQLQQLIDSLTGNAHNRAIQDYTLGASGDPSSAYLGLAGLYGGQASSGANNLSSLIGNTVAKNGAQDQNAALEAILQKYGVLGGTSPAIPTPTTAIPDSALGL